MTIVLYLCENNVRDYAENIAKKNDVMLCVGNDDINMEEYSGLSSRILTIDDLGIYDYLIILSVNMTESDKIRANLVARGVSQSKILEYCYFIKSPSKSPIEVFHKEHLREHYDTFLFGMSHSFGGCLEPLLKGNTYKFSAPSMDLYYHYKVLNDVCICYDMSKVKKILFELPYYAFNYDISMCKNTFLQRMNYYYYFGDYHHFGENDDEKQQVVLFETMNDICDTPVYASRLTEECIVKSKSLIYRVPQKLFRKIKLATMTKTSHVWTEEERHILEQLHPHVWYRQHDKTIEENRRIWESIKKLLEQYDNLDWKVIVFPFNPIFIKKNKDAIATMKMQFMKELNIPKNKVIDCFEYYMEHEELFEDECHLNLRGAYDFSKIIRNVLSREY